MAIITNTAVNAAIVAAFGEKTTGFERFIDALDEDAEDKTPASPQGLKNMGIQNESNTLDGWETVK